MRKNICRFCESKLDKELVLLKSMPLTDEFVKKDLDQKEYIEDIHIFQCSFCGLVQNPADMNYSQYYQEYNYSSGHSKFTKLFMSEYAKVSINEYKNVSGVGVQSVLEVGSGDGEQLKCFLEMGVNSVLGIEPSAFLAKQSNNAGIPTILDLFSIKTTKNIPSASFDICLSSYTFDHVPDPVDYLKAANRLLKNNGILSFEIHDLDQIYSRSEWCLFEHEHTVYMNSGIVSSMVNAFGFEVVAINPLNKKLTRANSLIVMAKKIRSLNEAHVINFKNDNYRYNDLNKRINQTIKSIDNWIARITECDSLIGWGVGGRGVMTLAAITNSDKFQAIIDSNYTDEGLLTPKTRVPILGVENLSEYRDSYCLVFSFGYIDEIREVLLSYGFQDRKIISLDYFYM